MCKTTFPLIKSHTGLCTCPLIKKTSHLSLWLPTFLAVNYVLNINSREWQIVSPIITSDRPRPENWQDEGNKRWLFITDGRSYISTPECTQINLSVLSGFLTMCRQSYYPGAGSLPPRWDQTRTDLAQSMTSCRLVWYKKSALSFDPIRVMALCVRGDPALRY